jgi:hypothetical protein
LMSFNTCTLVAPVKKVFETEVNAIIALE